MTDVAGLVERLSELVRHGNENRISIVSVAVDLVDNTASALQAQAAEIERLRDAEANLRDADAVIQRLNSGAELQAITAAHNDTLAKLREAVEVMRDIATSDDIDNCLDPERNKRVARAFLATMEKTDDKG